MNDRNVKQVLLGVGEVPAGGGRKKGEGGSMVEVIYSHA
jgi:hypothetical protein